MAAGAPQAARPRPDLAGVAWVVLTLTVMDGLLGLWAARNIYRSRHTSNVSDIGSAYFDPHGLLFLLSLVVASATVAAFPILRLLLGHVSLAPRALAPKGS